MPITERLPIIDGCAQWSVWGTQARIVLTDPRHLDEATALVRTELAAVDLACSRFRPDSETEAVFRTAGRPIRISSLLAELVRSAVMAAHDTDGDVDPTLGTSLAALGYDRDFAHLTPESGHGVVVVPSADWRRIEISGDLLTVPAGTRLDLGATAKAWAADHCAAAITDRYGTGALVALGGDIATAGPAPNGWNVLVHDGPGEPAAIVTLAAGTAIATSSTISRSWQQGSRTLHHILDPRHGHPAARIWRTASVLADSCIVANTYSTAAIVRGDRAPRWLRQRRMAARLVAADRSVIPVGAWPGDEQPSWPAA